MRLVRLTLVLTLVAALVALAGCNQNRTQADVKDQVEKSFEQAKLDNVNVDSDAEHKTLTLKGEVKTDADKQRAEQLAREAASGWEIANEIAVRPEGEMGDRAEDIDDAKDSAIKASLDSEYEKANIKNAGFDYDVQNGVVKLSGNVEKAVVKQQAETIAKKVKDVEQVVNNIEIGDRDMLPASDRDASEEKKD